MANEWEETTVGELVKRGILERPMDGNHGSIHPKGDDFVATGVPFIMASDLVGGGIDTINCSFITLKQANSLRKGFAKQGDVLISHKATLGRTALVGEIPGEFVMLTPQVTYYRPKDPAKLNNRYLKYYFDSERFQQVLRSWAGAGSTRAYIGITDQLRLPILLPPLAEQKSIAAVLGALDDKIELNRRMNATLEAMARALFQSWFVDFDPVRAKQEGRAPTRLDEATAVLFPTQFQNSETGEIPGGWEVRSLDQIAHYLNGLALQKYPPGDGPTLPVIKIAQLRKGGSEGADRCNTGVPREYVIADGDVLFSWSGSLEVRIWGGGPGALNQHLFKVTSEEFPKWFYYLWTCYHLEDFRRTAASKATTMGHIQRQHLTKAKALVPPPVLLEAMTRLMSPFIDQLIANYIQSRTLAAVRDTLLPKLVTGELRIPEADWRKE
jgi:type I restriction enzyme S subunit